MKAKLATEKNGAERTYVLVFAEGDEVLAELQEFAKRENLTGSHLTAIGAFREATLGFFEVEQKRYAEIPVTEQVEVLSLTGDIFTGPEGPVVHVHVVLGRRDGSAVGGHVLRAVVRPTLEMILTELPVNLRKQRDPQTGLALLRLD